MSTHFQPDQDQGLLTTHAARRMFLSGIDTLGVLADRQQLRQLCGDPTPTFVPQRSS